MNNKNILIGIGLIALGAVLTLGSQRAGGGGRIFYGLIVVGLFRLFRGLTAPAEPAAERQPLVVPPGDDPRWKPSSARQIAGQACTGCMKRFVTVADGSACKQCNELFHTHGCMPRHVRLRHAPSTPS